MSTETREYAKKLTAQMTLEEKMSQMLYESPAIDRLGIPAYNWWNEALHGVARAGVATVFPQAIALAATFDEDLLQKIGDVVSTEGRAKFNEFSRKGDRGIYKGLTFWAPNVNIFRDPRWGRGHETYGEDPYLTGICAVQITKGVQENHPVRVCPKHFAVNEQETYRRGSAKKRYDAVDSILTERALRELYLKPFEMLVRDAGVSFIMTSFNKINGVLAAGNRDLCTHILREEWNFDGVVVTDWGDMDIVADGGDAVAAGNDIVMPGGPPVIRQILQAYQERRITRKDLERSVARLLHVLKLFEKGERI